MKPWIHRKLENIAVPTKITECRNLLCKDPRHIEALDWFATETLGAIQAATEEAIPTPKISSNHKKKPTPGFIERVKPAKDTAVFWHSIWKAAGRPLNTVLHNIMKSTRSKYHSAFKKCQKDEYFIKKDKLLNACINGKGDLLT